VGDWATLATFLRVLLIVVVLLEVVSPVLILPATAALLLGFGVWALYGDRHRNRPEGDDDRDDPPRLDW